MNDNPITSDNIVTLAKDLHPDAYADRLKNGPFVYDGLSMLVFHYDRGWWVARSGRGRGTGGVQKWSPVLSMDEVGEVILKCKNIYATSNEERQRAANERVKTLRKTPDFGLSIAVYERLNSASGTIETDRRDNSEG